MCSACVRTTIVRVASIRLVLVGLDVLGAILQCAPAGAMQGKGLSMCVIYDSFVAGTSEKEGTHRSRFNRSGLTDLAASRWWEVVMLVKNHGGQETDPSMPQKAKAPAVFCLCTRIGCQRFAEARKSLKRKIESGS